MLEFFATRLAFFGAQMGVRPRPWPAGCLRFLCTGVVVAALYVKLEKKVIFRFHFFSSLVKSVKPPRLRTNNCGTQLASDWALGSFWLQKVPGGSLLRGPACQLTCTFLSTPLLLISFSIQSDGNLPARKLDEYELPISQRRTEQNRCYLYLDRSVRAVVVSCLREVGHQKQHASFFIKSITNHIKLRNKYKKTLFLPYFFY